MTRLAILGAGPIGLEAALAAAERGLDFTLYEAAPAVGGHVRRWGHVRLFTPWPLNISPRARAALGAAAPDSAELPTGRDLVDRVLEPLAAAPAVAGRLRLDTRVRRVAREGLLKHEEIGSAERARRPFRLLVSGPDGHEVVERADVVIDATGTYGHPNRLGDGGIEAPGEATFQHRIEHFLPDFEARPAAWAGRTILLTGAGHSAQTAARELAALAREAEGTRVVWAIRARDPNWGTVPADPLPERAALALQADALRRGESPAVQVRTGRVTDTLAGRGNRIAVTLRNGGAEEIEVDHILALNGGAPDAALYRQLQVHECYASLAPMNLAASLQASGGGDCLAQTGHGPETLRNPEPGFFILGAKSYGRDSRFLLRIGWQQVDDVFGALL